MINVRQDKAEKRYALHKLTKFATKNLDCGYVNGLQVDSRKILPGNAFVAIKGLRNNGLNYIEDAVARGASAVLAEPSINSQISNKIPVIEIPNLKEVSIGHALISDAIYLGLENTIQMYKRLL